MINEEKVKSFTEFFCQSLEIKPEILTETNTDEAVSRYRMYYRYLLWKYGKVFGFLIKGTVGRRKKKSSETAVANYLGIAPSTVNNAVKRVLSQKDFEHSYIGEIHKIFTENYIKLYFPFGTDDYEQNLLNEVKEIERKIEDLEKKKEYFLNLMK